MSLADDFKRKARDAAERFRRGVEANRGPRCTGCGMPISDVVLIADLPGHVLCRECAAGIISERRWSPGD